MTLAHQIFSPRAKVTNTEYRIKEIVPIELILDDKPLEFIRNRRSVSDFDHFPQTLSFKFQTSFGEVKLDLQRNDLINIPPVYLWNGQQVVKNGELKMQRDFAVYQGDDMGASALVTFPSNDYTQFELHASYMNNGQWFSIEPLKPSRNKRSVPIQKPVFPTFPPTTQHPAAILRSHLIQKLMEDLDFGDDYVIITNDSIDDISLSKHGDEQIRVQRVSGDSGRHSSTGSGSNVGGDGSSGSDDGDDGKSAKDQRSSIPITKIRNRQSRKKRSFKDQNFYNAKHRRKRQSTNQLYIEYLVCVDYANYVIWQSMMSGSTDQEIQDQATAAITKYYLYLVNGMDTRFKTALTTQGDLRVGIAGLVLAMDPDSSGWTEDNVITGNLVNDGNTLLNFAQWVNSQSGTLPTHDHAALFTGYNLAESASNSRTIGISYLSRVCNTYASSVNEELFNAISIHIAAHELGHSVGASHDSSSSCPSSMVYLMAGTLPNPANLSPSLAQNTYMFSSCSRSAIGQYIAGLSTNCLSNEPPYLNVLAGSSQTPYYVDEQCQLTYAPSTDTSFCRESYVGTQLKWSEICHKLRCKIPGSSSCSTHFSVDGTPCGNYKVNLINHVSTTCLLSPC
ncbi:hypothetical protein FSP39_012833 [Pinctada imbricata]|uniref:Peptidase M12B domain-containing protein n=1 Tax=Pinctada imbricata TaxID=66713 RepID=A0AA88YSW5_PINIB|nr:hypothetical protein FSP39_012833 [Pinctada imbricata]